MGSYLVKQTDLNKFQNAKVKVFLNGTPIKLNDPLKHNDKD